MYDTQSDMLAKLMVHKIIILDTRSHLRRLGQLKRFRLIYKCLTENTWSGTYGVYVACFHFLK